jgi:ABC-type multidrug transport system fused ATPase/permease subunit
VSNSDGSMAETAQPDAPMSRYQAFRFAWRVLPAAERRLLGLKVLSGIVIALIGCVPPLLIRTLLDTVLPNRDKGALAELVFAGAIIYGFLAVFGVIDQWLQSRITEGLGSALRNRFFDRIITLPFEFFVHASGGGLSSRLTVDIRTAQGVLREGGSIVTTMFNFITTLSVMFWLNAWVTLVALIVLPPIAFADRWFSGRIVRQSRSSLSAYSVMTSFAVERANPGAALLIRTVGDPASEAEEFCTRSMAV